MCDQDQLIEMGKGGLNRREFGAMSAMAALAACTTVEAENAGGLTENDVSFAAPGGTLNGFFVHPASGRHPGVILWPDIAGLREAKKVMARRLAGSGYSVLVPNPFYRSVAGEPFADFEAWRSGGGMQKVGPWMAKNTPDAVGESTRAVVANSRPNDGTARAAPEMTRAPGRSAWVTAASARSTIPRPTWPVMAARPRPVTAPPPAA